MNRVAARGLGGSQKRRLIEIAVGGLGRTDTNAPGGKLDVERVRVGGGISRHRFNFHLPAGPQHPQCDFAPVGNQNAPEHGYASR
ncbi:hypothetical protein SDC9_109855 [bioreactor metagenome]|uniref:Uncharacterized protein n=1 Tax=bioreactor metagenome TaxID=1076179 RepID=A0A645BCC8_9ZZZZ